MSEVRKMIEAELGPEKPYDPDYAVEVGSEPICNCPLCGRTHRKMPFGKPPPVISDTVVTIPIQQHEALMAAAFWLLKLRSLGYVQAGHGRKITDEILSIIRATGIEIKADSARDERLREIALRTAGIDLEEKT